MGVTASRSCRAMHSSPQGCTPARGQSSQPPRESPGAGRQVVPSMKPRSRSQALRPLGQPAETDWPGPGHAHLWRQASGPSGAGKVGRCRCLRFSHQGDRTPWPSAGWLRLAWCPFFHQAPQLEPRLGQATGQRQTVRPKCAWGGGSGHPPRACPRKRGAGPSTQTRRSSGRMTESPS